MRQRHDVTRPVGTGRILCGRAPADAAACRAGGRPTAGRARGDGGFSLVEMLIAMTVLTVVLGATLGVFQSESEGLREGLDRLEVLQNVRFGANAVEKDLRTAGSNVPDKQPKLVYADEDVVAFNADFVSNAGPDNEAVYYDPDAPDEEVRALTEERKITVPNGTFEYPDRDYESEPGSDVNSPAETIIFYFTPDSSTDRGDDWALFRRVNDREPQLVSRHLLRVDGTEAFLEYHKLVVPPSAEDSIATVQPGALPLAHGEPVHGSADDQATIDSVRAVRLRMAATNGETGEEEETRAVSRMIRIPNMGIQRKRVCGADPNGVPSLTASGEVKGGASTILVEWDASVDETASGEDDVARYMLWRKQPSDTEWGPPLVTTPVSGGPYSYRDTQVIPEEEYEYAVAAQDCTPNLSDKKTAGPVEAPNP